MSIPYVPARTMPFDPKRCASCHKPFHVMVLALPETHEWFSVESGRWHTPDGRPYLAPDDQSDITRCQRAVSALTARGAEPMFIVAVPNDLTPTICNACATEIERQGVYTGPERRRPVLA